MTEQTAIQQHQPTGMERVKNYMMSEEVKQRFTEMMGPEGNYYLNQVMMVVASSDELQKCEPASILISAIRAATLKLSVDPSSGQAWIIPYNGKATFQVGYKGVYDMAMRTKRYRYINVGRIYEGEILEEDRMTGIHKLKGGRTGNKTVGWLLYFELVDGFTKTFYMTVDEITSHAEHYSKAYRNPRSKWNDPFERWKMERKTVLINGLRQFGVFNTGDKQMLDQIEGEQEWIEDNDLPLEGEVTTPAEEPKKTVAELNEGLGFDPDPPAKSEPALAEEKKAVESVKVNRPMPPEKLREMLEKKAAGYSANTAVSAQQIGLLAGMMELPFAGNPDSDKIRHSCLKYLTGVDSGKDVSNKMVKAMLDWLKPVKDSGGVYLPDEMAAKELTSVWPEALKAAGQQEML